MRFNNGSNFVGEALKKKIQQQVKSFKEKHGIDWHVWERNLSAASHIESISKKILR